MPLPSFLVVGAAKCGTTSLFHYFRHHPDIFIPTRKECRFFSQMSGDFQGPGAKYQNDIIRTFEEYCDLYKNANHNAVAGDISNDYLYFYEKSISAIKQYLGEDIKIIILLRNPVERAYSHYVQHLQDGTETISFRQALEDEPKREEQNWSWTFLYRKTSLYSHQVKAFSEAFENVRVFLFEECWLKDKEKFLRDCFEFIDVEPITDIPEYRAKVSGYPKSNFVQNIFNRLGPVRRMSTPLLEKTIGANKTVRFRNYLRSLNITKKPLSREDRKDLLKYFEPDIVQLGRLLNRDMNVWIQ
jgi:hypothetical protein